MKRNNRAFGASKGARISSLAAVLVIAALSTAAPMRADDGAALDPAAYIPKDVVMAAVIDLTSSPEKDAAWERIKDAVQGTGLDRAFTKLLSQQKKVGSFDIGKELLSRLSGTGAVAALPEMKDGAASLIFVAQAKSGGDSREIMELISNSARKSKQELAADDYKGVSYYRFTSKETKGLCVGSINSAIVVGLPESVFKKVVDTANGEPNLLSDENFTKQRLVGGKTVATIYFSGSGLSELMNSCASRLPGEPGQAEAGIALLKNMLAGYVGSVGNAEASADGLKYTETGITTAPLPELEKKPLDELIADVPRDAGAALAISDWDKIWGLIKRQALGNPTLKTVVDQGVAALKAGSGIDIFEDALDRITGITVYYSAKRPAAPQGLPGQVALTLTVDKPEVVKATVKKFHQLVGGGKIRDYSIAGQTVSADPSDRRVQYANMLAGDKVVFMFSGRYVLQEMRDKIVAARTSASLLAAAGSFQRVKEQLPESAACLFYADVASIYKVFAGRMAARQLGVLESVLKTVSAVASSADMGQGGYQFRMVMPFNSPQPDTATIKAEGGR